MRKYFIIIISLVTCIKFSLSDVFWIIFSAKKIKLFDILQLKSDLGQGTVHASLFSFSIYFFSFCCSCRKNNLFLSSFSLFDSVLSLYLFFRLKSSTSHSHYMSCDLCYSSWDSTKKFQLRLDESLACPLHFQIILKMFHWDIFSYYAVNMWRHNCIFI